MKDLQEDVYKQLKTKKGGVTVFLKSAVRISGQIITMDKFTVLIMVVFGTCGY
ncbi:RNA chaperone Hfq [Bacillus cereus]|uniref:RNA-binding protein Hfq n=1 Tax=Bacillus cereus TaxID=1396 RepID=A0A2B1K835_BACCE|nr:RNA chaperone Hfq [Bacillus cereus]PFN20867.1 RNA-binding protein Hfq [Bacillus cereus]